VMVRPPIRAAPLVLKGIFQTIAHFNAHAPVLRGNDHQNTIVLVLPTQLPHLKNAYGKCFDAFTFQGRHREHGHLLGGPNRFLRLFYSDYK